MARPGGQRLAPLSAVSASKPRLWNRTPASVSGSLSGTPDFRRHLAPTRWPTTSRRRRRRRRGRSRPTKVSASGILKDTNFGHHGWIDQVDDLKTTDLNVPGLNPTGSSIILRALLHYYFVCPLQPETQPFQHNYFFAQPMSISLALPLAALINLIFSIKAENQYCCTSMRTQRGSLEWKEKKNQLPVGIKLGTSRYVPTTWATDTARDKNL